MRARACERVRDCCVGVCGLSGWWGGGEAVVLDRFCPLFSLDMTFPFLQRHAVIKKWNHLAPSWKYRGLRKSRETGRFTPALSNYDKAEGTTNTEVVKQKRVPLEVISVNGCFFTTKWSSKYWYFIVIEAETWFNIFILYRNCWNLSGILFSVYNIKPSVIYCVQHHSLITISWTINQLRKLVLYL